MSLQNLQAELAETILTHGQSETISPAANLTIYENNVVTNLVQALKNIYPLIVKLVGEDFFQIVAKEYIKQYPSRSGNLHDYGEYFSDFISRYSALRNLIYLTEVAQFEWICHTIFFAADTSGFDMATLEKISPQDYPHLYFVLHPASRLMKFHYPILRIIDLCKNDIDELVDINEGGIKLLIIRRDVDIKLVTLTSAEYAFLNALQENKSLSVALEIALQIDEQFNLEEKLLLWIKDNTLVDCCLNKSENCFVIPKDHHDAIA